MARIRAPSFPLRSRKHRMPDLALYYDNEPWLAPLRAALDARGVDYIAVDATSHMLDPADPTPPAPVVFNRIAMSSFKRDADHPIFHAEAAFSIWTEQGADVINGGEAFRIDHSKARQLALIARAGHAIPATRVVHRREDIAAAAKAIGYPLLVKGNIGGAGAGITRYDDGSELADAAANGLLPDSIDKVWLVQAYAAPRDGHIIRFEFLEDRFLYAIAVDGGGQFDLCPADACVAEPGKPTVTMAPYEPSEAMVQAARDIVRAAQIDVGGCEALIDDADGSLRFYDVNAFSNFAANPRELLGWDPHDDLADWLVARIAHAKANGPEEE